MCAAVCLLFVDLWNPADETTSSLQVCGLFALSTACVHCLCALLVCIPVLMTPTKNV